MGECRYMPTQGLQGYFFQSVVIEAHEDLVVWILASVGLSSIVPVAGLCGVSVFCVGHVHSMESDRCRASIVQSVGVLVWLALLHVV